MTNPAKLSANAAASKRAAVLSRIERACQAAGRDPAGVTLLAVGKRHPAAALATLYAQGQRHFGENYVQEARGKQAELPDDVVWHMIGPLQSNKSREVAEHFDWLHTLDSAKLARRLSQQRPPERGPLNVCIQVNLDDEASKSGVDAAGAHALAALVRELPGLRLRGLMAIPAPSQEPALQYERCAAVAALQAALAADCDTLSLGMSADLEAAIRAGSTLVRVGTDLFGPRPDSAGAA